MTPEQVANCEHYLKRLCDDYVDDDAIRETVSDVFAHIRELEAQLAEVQEDTKLLVDNTHILTRDIGEWLQFGKHLRRTSHDANHDPRSPTTMGIEKSEARLEDTRKMFLEMRQAIDSARVTQ